MRGTPVGHWIAEDDNGIIPAYAGNTFTGVLIQRLIGDHPRVCGEHQTNLSNQQTMQGSSPRMRGTHHSESVRQCGTGIIPAYAGNTSMGNPLPSGNGDHPRVCGEHHFGRAFLMSTKGSSPRMRGTPFRIAEIDGQIGIIPAYAGNTST